MVLPAKVPVIAGEQGICNGCGVATLSIDYYDLGYQAGTMAYDILANGTDIATMEVEYAPNVSKLYNVLSVSSWASPSPMTTPLWKRKHNPENT